MTRLSVPLDQAIAAQRRARRQAIRFPLRNRWLAVKLRTKVRLAELWTDLKYLVNGGRAGGREAREADTREGATTDGASTKATRRIEQ